LLDSLAETSDVMPFEGALELRFVCMKGVGLSSGVRGVAPGLIGLVSGEGGRVKRGLAQA
jgi:hypothetical protein